MAVFPNGNPVSGCREAPPTPQKAFFLEKKAIFFGKKTTKNRSYYEKM